jgi:hypothetical protein
MKAKILPLEENIKDEETGVQIRRRERGGNRKLGNRQKHAGKI